MTDRGYGRISLDTARSGSIAKQRERILLEPNEMLLELVTQHVGSESEGRDDRGGFLLP